MSLSRQYGRFADQEAHSSMLTDPAAHAPAYEWKPERLEVHHMDARRLEFPDGSFDAVFTVSSIEHFGGSRDVARAAAEIGRVLRTGGHAAVITDCAVRGRVLARLRRAAGRGEVFTASELDRLIIRPSGLVAMQSLDTTLSRGSFDDVVTQLPDGSLGGCDGPLILLRSGGSVFTSVCVVLEKPPAR
jgi:SAM-dependent methyltransferase